MNAHTHITKPVPKAKSVKIGSPTLPTHAPIPAPTDKHLAGLIDAFSAAVVEHEQHFDTPVRDGGHAACMEAVGKMWDAMHSICAYRPALADRAAWAAFLHEQIAKDFFDSEHRVQGALTALVNNVASTPPTVSYDSRAMINDATNRELEMFVLIRSFRDAAISIDPTIRGFWVSNSVGDDLPEGATTAGSVIFDRRPDRKAEFPREKYRIYLSSQKLEPLDLDELNIAQLIDLFKELDKYRSAVDDFVDCSVFKTFDRKGRHNGHTWNGEMIEVLRAWVETESSNIIQAIRARQPADSHDSYRRAMFLTWLEAEVGGNLTEIAAALASSAAEQLAFGEGYFGEEEDTTALGLMAEFCALDEDGQQQLLAVARDMAAQKQAA